MTDFTAGEARFEFGRVVGQTFGLIGRNFFMFLILALLFVGLPQFGIAYGQAYVAQIRPDLVVAGSIGAAILSMVLTYVLQGSLTRAAVDDLSGKGVRLGAALGDGFAFFFPLFIVALLVGIGLMIGFLLLIIPGLILAVRWVVSAPIVVVEREGPTASIGRSAELTEGHRWAIFGLLLLATLLFFAIGAGVEFGMQAFGYSGNRVMTMDALGIAFGALNAAVTAITTLISTVGTASLYFELRRVKEGVGIDDLAKVFD